MAEVIDSFNNNKYPSRYEIPMPIIKFAEPVLIKILTNLVNPSLTTGIPDQLKISKIKLQ